MTKVVLFGAGASYGALGVAPCPPPLGVRLFNELARRFPQTWGTLHERVRHEFQTKGFEHGMSKVWGELPDRVTSLTRHMAMYFSEFKPNNPGATLYCKLAQALGPHDEVTFATLNYECLLEQSLKSYDVDFSYGNRPSRITVLKLHGSCNILPDSIGFSGVGFVGADLIEHPVRYVSDVDYVYQFWKDQESSSGAVPSMAIYMPGKPTQANAGHIKRLQREWAERVGQAATLIICGVEPNPVDEHIWSPIAATQAKVYYVGPNGSAKRFRNWARVSRPHRPYYSMPGTFESRYDEIQTLLTE